MLGFGCGLGLGCCCACSFRMDSPLVMMVWAWCMSRSTLAVASVVGMIVSNCAGWRFVDSASEVFS